MGIYGDFESAWDENVPEDPLGTPFLTGSDNPLTIIRQGGPKVGPEKASTANLTAAMNRAFGTQDKLAAERAGFGGHFDPASDRYGAMRQRMLAADLAGAAAGKVPSLAEIQLRRQAGVNAARQFGLAAALQGRNPGAALRSGRLGALATQAGTNVDAAMLRAGEQERARALLGQVLAQQRAGDQGLLGADVDWRKALLGGEVKTLDSGIDAAGAQFKGENLNAAATNQFNMEGAKAIGQMFSDERLKEDVKPAKLEKLAESLKGFRFRYKDQAHGEGERVGVMAQDAQKGGPIGKGMVKMDGAGRLKLDVGNAVGAALAMSAQALRETKKPLVSLRKAA
jgi:hypothetical protein